MKLFLLSFLLFLYLPIFSVPILVEDTKVPNPVKETLRKKFPESEKGKIEWSKDKEVYQAFFKAASRKNPKQFTVSCFFKGDGGWIKTMRIFDESSAAGNLPSIILDKSAKFLKEKILTQNSGALNIKYLFIEEKEESFYQYIVSENDKRFYLKLDKEGKEMP
jgi:hypothetical protein